MNEVTYHSVYSPTSLRSAFLHGRKRFSLRHFTERLIPPARQRTSVQTSKRCKSSNPTEFTRQQDWTGLAEMMNESMPEKRIFNLFCLSDTGTQSLNGHYPRLAVTRAPGGSRGHFKLNTTSKPWDEVLFTAKPITFDEARPVVRHGKP